MKLLPLIGSLLISAAPVQAFETFEELDKACQATEEHTNLCQGSAEYGFAALAASLLCNLEAEGILTKEETIVSWDNLEELFIFKAVGTPMWNVGAEMILERRPECSIKT